MTVLPNPPMIAIRAVPGMPELTAGDDIARLLLAAGPGLVAGDVVMVSSKAVAKADGRVAVGTRADLLDAESDRTVARRGPLRIVRTPHGLVLAAAGVDASNTAAGTVVPLPLDPDGSARSLRHRLFERAEVNVAVIVTDTAGRAWRTGQTDIAVGCAGLEPVLDLAGRPDATGRPLEVTAPAVADELAGAAELVLAKAARTPVAVVSGLGDLVLPPGVHGPGAAALVRPEDDDLFGLGATDAVHAAVRRAAGDARGFPADPAAPVAVLDELTPLSTAGQDCVSVVVSGPGDSPLVVVRPVAGRRTADPDVLLGTGSVGERLRVLAWARGLRLTATPAPPGATAAWAAHRRP